MGTLIVSVSASALNLSYVSPTEKSSLEADYSAASMEIPAQLEGTWTCELIGVRSGLLRETGIVLYDFKNNSNGTYKNEGASPHTQFKSSSNKKELLAENSKIKETLRFLSADSLIGQIEDQKSHKKLAYSRCLKSSKSLTKSSALKETVASHD
tara:strand:+ start:350 stop:811 length:462 start_codon:yes stop_codon:yes gene_type:complete